MTENLNAREFNVIGVANGNEFRVAWAEQPADILILDIELGANQDNGSAIVTSLRTSSHCGIVMVTARSETNERLTGLGIGADTIFKTCKHRRIGDNPYQSFAPIAVVTSSNRQMGF